MDRVKLPTHVTDRVACADLGRRVRAGLVALDWSEVESIDRAAAEALCAEWDLAAMPDEAGIDTVKETVADVLTAVLEGRPPKAAKAPPRKRGAKAPAGADRVGTWTAPTEGAPPAPRVFLKEEPRALRSKLEEMVLRDLLGPAGGDDEELLERSVRDRYLVGVLAPGRQRVEPEAMDSLEVGEESNEEGSSETDASAGTMMPSSIGLSFRVPLGASLRVRVSYGRYRRQKSESKRDEDGFELWAWKRQPMCAVADLPPLVAGTIGPVAPFSDAPRVVVRGVARASGETAVVSLFLVNEQEEPERLRDEAWLFQPRLEVTSATGDAVFLGRSLAADLGEELPVDENARIDMLYRNRLEHAVGHGVGVHVDVAPDDPRRATRVATEVVPRHEVGAQRARMPAPPGERGAAPPDEDPRLRGVVLDMKSLAEMARHDVRASLDPLVLAYEAWIADRRADVEAGRARGVAPPTDAAREALAACDRAAARIRRGIELVASSDHAFESFRFANRAMWLQRVHGKLAEKARRGETATLDEVDRPENRTWRTFQIAFVLLNLESITDLGHADRVDPTSAIADLLWFPTGGGKTEAYLGLAAYTMALRRLQGVVEGRDGGSGVAVLMRYTLRLLTLQQFQRASALMCACEVIRREAAAAGDPRWGAEPFRIGLWVGAKSTPNSTRDAQDALSRRRGTLNDWQGGHGGRGSPVQLKSCPWCGEAIEPARDMEVRPYPGDVGRTLVWCGDKRGACAFSRRSAPGEGLPVVVVDEEIYRLLPTLLIATVDKFAQMPWKGPVQMLFGQVEGRCPRHGFRSPELEDTDSHQAAPPQPAVTTVPTGPLRPPDLIIQDELHLISGPLGSLTGLYETAVDELCTWEVGGVRVRPKVIASTATVRRAREQVHALFLRRVEVFPPPGIDVEDSFFSVERAPADVPGRLYLGICAPGRRLKAALIRVYLALLASAKALFESHGDAGDPWMTLVGYFGSIRELGGMRRLVDDDVRTKLPKMKRRGLGARFIDVDSVQELTSRMGSTQIPELLDRLEVPFVHTTQKKKGAKRPVDVLLATNMISVGVDVPRFGLMVCTGQPKTTAEYIQATSRVGRAAPGLVVTVYNWARPRDLSHYETFEHYHATFYRHVEALSLTPFSPRAIDRGLTAVLASLVRLASPRYNPNHGAGAVDFDDAAVQAAASRIARRAEHVEQQKATFDAVERDLRARMDLWRHEAIPRPGKPAVGYAAGSDGVTTALLKKPTREAWDVFTCLNSLRDVEPTSPLLLIDGGLDDDPPARGA